MKNFKKLWLLFFSLFSITVNGQNDSLSKIKHIEIISEVRDTMVLINKDDINKINKVFFERNYLDSLRVVDSCLIKGHEEMKQKMDSIVMTQLNTIDNQKNIIEHYKNNAIDNNQKIVDLENQHRKDKNSKIAWQSATGTLAAIVLILLLV